MGTFRPDAKARHNVACARGKTTRNMKRHDTDEQSKARHSHHSGQDETRKTATKTATKMPTAATTRAIATTTATPTKYSDKSSDQNDRQATTT